MTAKVKALRRIRAVAVQEQEFMLKFDPIMMNEFGGQEVEVFISGVKDTKGNHITDVYTTAMVPLRHDSMGTNLWAAYNGAGGIDVAWYYSSEIEAKGFELQRLYATNFETIATFEDLEALTDYAFEDLFNFKGDVYYRVKYLGTEDVHSKIIKAAIDETAEMVPKSMVYPNPSSERDELKFRFLTRDFENDVTVRIYTPDGALVTTKVFAKEEVEQTFFTIHLKNELSQGMYFVEITQGDHVSVQRVIYN